IFWNCDCNLINLIYFLIVQLDSQYVRGKRVSSTSAEGISTPKLASLFSVLVSKLQMNLCWMVYVNYLLSISSLHFSLFEIVSEYTFLLKKHRLVLQLFVDFEDRHVSN
ncbi:hypothetical protein L9F63_023673, partial [Diploptera punctata]